MKRVIIMRRLLLGTLLVIASLVIGIPSFISWLKPVEIQPGDVTVRLYRHDTGEVQRLELEDYVAGVVAAEMPAAFPGESLKAQAVAARTYVLKRLNAGGIANSIHEDADACDDHRHGQAWISREEMRQRWGALGFYKYFYKIRQAVDETRGLVITHNGLLIDPVYHSSCGGLGTENSGEVWSSGVPYLQGVSCSHEETAGGEHEVVMTVARVEQALKTNLSVPASSATGTQAAVMAVLEQTGAGRPKTVEIGDKIYPSTMVRDLLGLRSANFTCELEGDNLRFTTRGYGHAVGMCQYGAKAMAEEGKKYDEILKHYYNGVNISRMKE